MSEHNDDNHPGPADAMSEGGLRAFVSSLLLPPYRVSPAGVRTWEINSEPLTKKIETVGSVEFDERRLYRISARVKGRLDKLYANVTGQTVHPGDPLADIYSP